MDASVRAVLDAAERDPNVIGVVLKGSQATGSADELSDWDVVVVLAEGEPSHSQGRLGELEPLILGVARTGDPRRQQELQARVEQVAAAHGFRDVYDAWDGEIERVMSFRFD